MERKIGKKGEKERKFARFSFLFFCPILLFLSSPKTLFCMRLYFSYFVKLHNYSACLFLQLLNICEKEREKRQKKQWKALILVCLALLYFLTLFLILFFPVFCKLMKGSSLCIYQAQKLFSDG